MRGSDRAVPGGGRTLDGALDAPVTGSSADTPGPAACVTHLPLVHFPGRLICAQYFRSSLRRCSLPAATTRIPTARRARRTAIRIRRPVPRRAPTRDQRHAEGDAHGHEHRHGNTTGTGTTGNTGTGTTTNQPPTTTPPRIRRSIASACWTVHCSSDPRSIPVRGSFGCESGGPSETR